MSGGLFGILGRIIRDIGGDCSGISGGLFEDIGGLFDIIIFFAATHIIFPYPKKLSYSSRNAYIKKIRVRLLGDASCLLKNFKTRLKTYEFFW